MQVTITYQLNSGEIRSKWFIRDSVEKAISFFNWRYGHKIISVK